MLLKFFFVYKLEFIVIGYVRYLIMIKNLFYYSKYCIGFEILLSFFVVVWWIYFFFLFVNKYFMVIKYCIFFNKVSILFLLNLLYENIIERWKIYYVCRRRVIILFIFLLVVLREAFSLMWFFVSVFCNFLMVFFCFCIFFSFLWCLVFSLSILLFSFWIVLFRIIICNL